MSRARLSLYIIYNVYDRKSTREKVGECDIIYLSDVVAARLSRTQSRREVAGRLASTYIASGRVPRTRRSLDRLVGIFYSTRRIFAAEHVSAVQKTYRRICNARVPKFSPWKNLRGRILAILEIKENTSVRSFLFFFFSGKLILQYSHENCWKIVARICKFCQTCKLFLQPWKIHQRYTYSAI